MNELRFSWRDEDPVALIFLIILVIVLFMVPWQSCDPLEGLKTPPAAASTPGK
jgi:hypothetical protein